MWAKNPIPPRFLGEGKIGNAAEFRPPCNEGPVSNSTPGGRFWNISGVCSGNQPAGSHSQSWGPAEQGLCPGTPGKPQSMVAITDRLQIPVGLAPGRYGKNLCPLLRNTRAPVCESSNRLTHVCPHLWRVPLVVLGFRWDCEDTAQIWSSCADIEIIA